MSNHKALIAKLAGKKKKPRPLTVDGQSARPRLDRPSRRLARAEGGTVAEDQFGLPAPGPAGGPAQDAWDRAKEALIEGTVNPAGGGGPYKPSFYKKGGGVKKMNKRRAV